MSYDQELDHLIAEEIVRSREKWRAEDLFDGMVRLLVALEHSNLTRIDGAVILAAAWRVQTMHVQFTTIELDVQFTALDLGACARRLAPSYLVAERPVWWRRWLRVASDQTNKLRALADSLENAIKGISR